MDYSLVLTFRRARSWMAEYFWITRRPSKSRGSRSSCFGREAAIRFAWKAVLHREILHAMSEQNVEFVKGLYGAAEALDKQQLLEAPPGADRAVLRANDLLRTRSGADLGA
jgi:hypothetical protein